MKLGTLEIKIEGVDPTNRHASKRRAQKMLRAGLKVLEEMDAYYKHSTSEPAYDDMNMARVYLTAAVMRLEKLAN